MRLADQRRCIARLGQLPGEAAISDLGAQIDAIVLDAMGLGQLAGQDRGPRGLADRRRGDAGRRMDAFGPQPVQMGCLDPPPGEPIAIGALLVRGNEDDIGTLGHLTCLLD